MSERIVNEINDIAPASSQRTGVSYPHDVQIWDRVEQAVTAHERPLRDVLESFPLYTRRVNLTRFLAHYELYKRIAPLPGSIVECGVFRGSSLLTWAKLLEIFHAGDRVRKVIGFDNFAGFTTINEKDGPELVDRCKMTGGWNSAPYYDELLEHVRIFQDDSFLPRARRVELVVGDLTETACRYVAENPGLRISLLHLDVDVYEPTLAALQAFYPLVVPGGLIVLDEYGLPDWAGESAAVEEYFRGRMPQIEKLPFSSTPGGYIVKKD